jgi:hypothetical protein
MRLHQTLPRRYKLIARSYHGIYDFRHSVLHCRQVGDLMGRDGGIGRRVGLRIQCPKGVQVQILFPAPSSAILDHRSLSN